MMNSMGGEDDLPDLDGADDVRVLFFFSLTAFLFIRVIRISVSVSNLLLVSSR